MEKEMVIDTSWLEGEPLPPNNKTQRAAELEMLKDLAANVGQYEYNYTQEANEDPTLPSVDDKDHLGIMAQDLLKIPGLASCVNSQLDGNNQETYTIDTGKLALAAMGYVAALSKIVLDMRGIEYDNSSKANANQLPTETSNEGGAEGTETGAEGTEEGYETGSNPTGTAAQTADSPANVYDKARAVIGE